jgi:hypothetical protein
MVHTIEDGKQYLKSRLSKGATCPCCNQFVKMYPTKIDPPMAAWLISLVNKYEKLNRYIDLKELPTARNGNYAKLKHWELVEQAENTDETKRSAGKWRPTQLGIDFAKGEATVSEKCNLYNRKPYGFEGKRVTIFDCLRNKFNYKELMGN